MISMELLILFEQFGVPITTLFFRTNKKIMQAIFKGVILASCSFGWCCSVRHKRESSFAKQNIGVVVALDVFIENG